MRTSVGIVLSATVVLVVFAWAESAKVPAPAAPSTVSAPMPPIFSETPAIEPSGALNPTDASMPSNVPEPQAVSAANPDQPIDTPPTSDAAPVRPETPAATPTSAAVEHAPADSDSRRKPRTQGASVNRPLADQLTHQLNRQELGSLQSSGSSAPGGPQLPWRMLQPPR